MGRGGPAHQAGHPAAPQEPDFYLIQARVALAQGQRKDAIKALEKARKWAMPEMQARYDSQAHPARRVKPP